MALKYANSILSKVLEEQTKEKVKLFTDLQNREVELAETLRGPSKFLVDVAIVVDVPQYAKLPIEPEDSYSFIIAGRFNSPMSYGIYSANEGYYLWYKSKWVKINTAMLRDLSNYGLRNTFFEAVRKQERKGVKKKAPNKAVAMASWKFYRGRYGI